MPVPLQQNKRKYHRHRRQHLRQRRHRHEEVMAALVIGSAIGLVTILVTVAVIDMAAGAAAAGTWLPAVSLATTACIVCGSCVMGLWRYRR